MGSTPRTEIVYGVHPVYAALSVGRRPIYALYVSGAGKKKKRLDPLKDLAEKAGVPITETTVDQIERMTGPGVHQGVALVAGPYPLVALAEVPAISAVSADSFLLIADGVVDPQNLGALIRTAACVGVDAVIIPKDKAASPTPAVSKASAGAMEAMAIVRETNIARTVDGLKENGFWVTGLESGAGKVLFDAELTGPVALVIGGEDRGIRRLVREKCDAMVAIPQQQTINSLNASVAGGIAMYEVLRQRLMNKKGK